MFLKSLLPNTNAVRLLSLFATAITVNCSVIENQAIARPGVEIVPVAVWQGKTTRPWSLGVLRDIRQKFPNMRMAHAVSALPLARGDEFDQGFRNKFAKIIQPGDDILLHVAPWKSLVERSNVKFRYEPTVFGVAVNPEDCAIDCGLDLSFNAFSPSEVRSIVAHSKSILAAGGFGQVKAVFFDEGVVSGGVRSAALGNGISEDWSGVEMTQLRGTMMRFPVYNWNVANLESFPLDKLDITLSDGLNLDHARYGIQAEIGDLASTTRIIKNAIETAIKSDRTLRLPIVFNVEDLIHTQTFVEEALQKATQIAGEMSVPIREWRALNSSWDQDAIKRGVVTAPLVAVQSANTGEAEFVSNDERLLSIELAH